MQEGARNFVFSINTQTDSEARATSHSVAPGFFPRLKQPGCEERGDSSPCIRQRMGVVITVLMLGACVARTERTWNVCALINYSFNTLHCWPSKDCRVMNRSGKMWRGYSRSGIETVVTAFV